LGLAGQRGLGFDRRMGLWVMRVCGSPGIDFHHPIKKHLLSKRVERYQRSFLEGRADFLQTGEMHKLQALGYKLQFSVNY
jgi:hypothetical protein